MGYLETNDLDDFSKSNEKVLPEAVFVSPYYLSNSNKNSIIKCK